MDVSRFSRSVARKGKDKIKMDPGFRRDDGWEAFAGMTAWRLSPE
jgi:hypothetical protein